MHQLFQNALTEYLKPEEHTKSASVWPSQILKCPRAHAHERRGDPKVHAFLSEFSQSSQLLMRRGLEVEKRWFEALSLVTHCQRQVKVDHDGINGRIDILLENYTPIEIKYTDRKDLGHHWQLAAYMYALAASTGYLILEHRDGSIETVQMLCNGAIFKSFAENGEPYCIDREPVKISYHEMRRIIAAHNEAFEKPELGTLALPTIGKCLRPEGEFFVPCCPYFCWGGAELKFDPDWNEGDCTVQIDGKPYQLGGSW